MSANPAQDPTRAAAPRRVSADDFIALVQSTDPAAISDLVVSETVPFTGREFPRPILIHNCTFLGLVVFRNCFFQHSLDLTGCRFEGGVDFSDSAIGGQLSFKGGSVGLNSAPASPMPIFLLRATEVEGNLDMSEMTIRPVATMTGVRISGDLLLSGSQLESDLELEGARIGGKLSAEPNQGRGVFRCGKLNLESAVIEGWLDLSGAKIRGELSCEGAKAGGLFLRVARLDPGQQGKKVRHERAEVLGCLEMSAARFAHVEFNGALLSGGVRALDTVISGSLWGYWDGPSGRSLECGANLDLTGLAAHGGLDLDGARVKGNVVLRNSRFGRELSLSAPFRSPTPRATKIEGFLDCSNAQVEGMVDLRGIQVKRAVYLSYSRFRGSVLLNSVNLGRLRTRVGGELAANSIRVRGDFDASGIVVAGRTNLDGSQVDGAVSFGTITVQQKQKSTKGRVADTPAGVGVRLHGGIRASQLKCGAYFVFVGLARAKRGEGASIQLDGANVRGGVYIGSGESVRHASAVLSSSGGPGFAISLGEAVLGGSLMVRGVFVKGRISLEGLRTNHDVFFVRPRESPHRVRVTQECFARGIRVGGSLLVGAATFDEDLDLSGIEVGQDVLLGASDNARWTHFSSKACIIAGRLKLDGSTIKHRMSCNGVRVNGRVSLDGCRVGGSVSLASSENSPTILSSGVSLEFARIGGSLSLRGAKLCAPYSSWIGAPTVSLTSVRIEGNLSFGKNEPSSPRNLTSLASEVSRGSDDRVLQRAGQPKWIAQSDAVITEIVGEIRGNRCTVLGSAWFDFAVLTKPAHPGASRVKPGSLTLRDSRIHGHLDLSESQIAGDLDLRGTQIEGYAFYPRSSSPTLSCPHVEGSVILDRANLSELSIKFCRHDASNKPAAAATTALPLQRKQLTIPKFSLPGRNNPGSRVSHPKGLSLMGAKIISLRLAGELPGVRAMAFNMSGADVATIDCSRLKGSEGDNGGGVRRVLRRTTPFNKATYLQLEDWHREAGEDAIANRIYLDMRLRAILAELAGGAGAHESIRQRLPAALPPGEPASLIPKPTLPAGVVPPLPVSKLREAFGGALRWISRIPKLLLDYFLYVSVGYGVSAGRLVPLGFILFLFSWGIFADPRSVERRLHPGEAASRAQTSRLTVYPDSGGWEWHNAFWMALKTHVPVIPIRVNDDFIPSRNSIQVRQALRILPDSGRWLARVIAKPSGGGMVATVKRQNEIQIFGWSYDSYAGTIEVISWIMVPLILASASGLLKKKG